MKNFVVFYEEEDIYKYICSCGEYIETKEEIEECPNCKTTLFKQVSKNFNGGRVCTDLIFKILENESYGFDICKIKLWGHYSKKNKTLEIYDSFKSNMIFSYKNKEFKIIDGDLVYNNPKSYHILNWFDTIWNMQKIYSKLHKNIKETIFVLSPNKNYWSDREFIIQKGFSRLLDNETINILINCGINAKNIKNAIFPELIDVKATQPHKILDIPKYTLDIFKEEHYERRVRYVLNKKILNILDKKLGANNLKYLLEKTKEESDMGNTLDLICDYAENIIEFVNENNYKVTTLIDYLYRYVKLEQGINNPKEAYGLLKDYVNMSKDLNVSYEKYPKSLKKTHDICMMNYSIKKDEIKNEEFKEAVTKYKNLEYSCREFSIITPKEANDLNIEGNKLSHCVASYVNDVINRKCDILFLRRTENLNEPYITIEVRNNRVVQCKGYGNRYPNKIEEEYIQKWKENKNLN